jgi:hypothetical protein
MLNKPIAQSLYLISSIRLHSRYSNYPIRVRVKVFVFLSILSTFLYIGCSAIHRPAPVGSLGTHETASVISRILDQENRVSSFYTSGTVLVKGWIWKSEAEILIAGIKEPLKIKIEITHPWGKPILHVLIDNKRLEVLSFDEKRRYLGKLTPKTLSRFFPWKFCDHDLIWSLLRGYPHLARHHGIESSGENRISLLDQKDAEIEVIDLYPESLLPKRVSFPSRSLVLDFSGFKEDNGTYYATEVMVNNIKGGKDLVLKRKKMVFNKTIPDQIFILEKPPAFETVWLDDVPDDSDK